MKLFIAVAILVTFCVSAHAESCQECIATEYGPCAIECLDPADPECWACLLFEFASCILTCSVS